MRLAAGLVACLWTSAVLGQTAGEPAPPPLTAAEEPTPPPAEAPAAPAPAETPPSSEPERDRTFVKNAGMSAAALGGGLVIGGIAGAIAGGVVGVMFGASFGPFVIIAVPLFAVVFGAGGLIIGALGGGGLGFLGSLFLIAPPPQEREAPANVLTVAPVGLLARRLSLEYERRLSPHYTVFAAPLFEADTTSSSYWRGGTGFSLTAGVRGYLWGQAPRGAFIGVEAHGGSGRFTHYFAPPGAVVDGTPFVTTRDVFTGAGVTFGHTWLIANHVPISFGLGAVYQVSFASAPEVGERVFHEFVPTVRLNVGAAL